MTIKSDINLYKVKLEIAELYMIESCFTAGMTPRDIYDALEKHSTLLLRELKQLVPNITDSDSLPSKVRKRREKRTAREMHRAAILGRLTSREMRERNKDRMGAEYYL